MKRSRQWLFCKLFCAAYRTSAEPFVPRFGGSSGGGDTGLIARHVHGNAGCTAAPRRYLPAPGQVSA